MDLLDKMEQEELEQFRKSIASLKKEANQPLKRSSVNKSRVKPQNYVKPEISYVGKIPDYSSFHVKSKAKTEQGPGDSGLAHIQEEPSTSMSLNPPKQSGPREAGEDPRPSEPKSEENYLGLFDILMKELSDLPKGIKERLSRVDSEIFEDKLVRIKRKKDPQKLSFEQQIKKLSACTYNCNQQELRFDLEKGESG